MTPLLLMSLAIESSRPALPFAPPAPSPTPCIECPPSRSQGPPREIRTWFTKTVGAGLGIAAGLAVGRSVEAPPKPVSTESVGLAFRGGKPLILWGGVAALGLTKMFIHRTDEPALRAAPWKTLPAPPSLDAAVRNATARHLSRKARRLIDSSSYVTLGYLAAQPLGLAFGGSSRENRKSDFLIPAEAATIAGLAAAQVKHLVHRPRPFAYYCEPLDGNDMKSESAHFSFFSGHTSIAFALAAATSTVASRRGLKDARRIRNVSYSLAAATGAFRVLGDRHYTTDVLVGGVVGWATGRAIANWRTKSSPASIGSAEFHPVSLSFPISNGVVRASFGKGFAATLVLSR